MTKLSKYLLKHRRKHKSDKIPIHIPMPPNFDDDPFAKFDDTTLSSRISHSGTGITIATAGAVLNLIGDQYRSSV